MKFGLAVLGPPFLGPRSFGPWPYTSEDVSNAMATQWDNTIRGCGIVLLCLWLNCKTRVYDTQVNPRVAAG